MTPPTTATTAVRSDEASYEVHEWGLLRAGEGDVLEVGAVGPEVSIPLMVVEKPVLYFHLASGGSLDLSVARVDAVDGEIREHWPLAAPPVAAVDPTTLSWAPLSIRRGTCAFVGPRDRSEACAPLPPAETCESLLLDRATTTDSDCLETASGRSPLLFYRSTSRGLVAPLRASASGTEITVAHGGSTALPGRIVRFTSTPGSTRVAVASPPAPGSSTTVEDRDDGADAARRAIVETMRELGLTEAEAGAFLTSWDAELFPAEVVVEEAMERVPAPVTTLLYFLPTADADRVARLSFSPSPVAVRRAMAVWTAVR